MLTKLQAINEILTAAGEQAVLTLVTGAADSTNAETILNQETLKVLAKGWVFNTENGIEIQPDASGRIAIPADAIRVDPQDQSVNLVERGGYLYDPIKRTNVIGKAIKLNIIRSLSFEDVPYSVQDYIVQRAKKKYQRAYVGSQTLDAFNRSDEADAQALAVDADAEDGDFNILNKTEISDMAIGLRRLSFRGRFA